MPAHRSYRPRDFEDDFSIRVEGDLEPKRLFPGSKSIYFTDQSPRFTIITENTSDKLFKGKTYIRLSFEKSENVYESWGTATIEFELEPGEKDTFDLRVEMLAYQGSATISVDKISLTENDEMIKVRMSHNRRYQMYTFVVYDRDYYRVNYLTPRYAQYTSVILAVLIVGLGVLQLLS